MDPGQKATAADAGLLNDPKITVIAGGSAVVNVFGMAICYAI
jgi:hypothetical protein